MEKPLRVLMIAPTSFFLDYGCHVRILEEVRVLQRLGHSVTIVTYYLGSDLPGLEIVRTRPTPWRSDYEVGSSLHKLAFDYLLSWRVLRTALRGKYDIIHAHLYDGALIGIAVGRLLRIPVILDRQGSLTGEMVDHRFLDPEGPWFRWVRLLEERINYMVDIIVTSTQMGAVQLERYFGCDCEHIRPLPDCVSLETFDSQILSAEERADRREALGIPAGVPVVAYLGLLADYQGIPQLLQSARFLKDRDVEGHFLIMGFPGVDHYRGMAQDLGISDRVTFTGKILYKDAPAHLALGDIAVAPKLSDTEGVGKILNYMAMELPTVTYDVPQSREYLGKWGVYANPVGDPVALADGIQTLLARPEGRVYLGKELRARVARHFSWERSGRRLVQIYRELLNQ